MKLARVLLGCLPVVLAGTMLHPRAGAAPASSALPRMQKRWLFIWREMENPKEVERVIERMPKAHADGYNGVVLSYNVAPSKAAELREAAKKSGLDLIAIVMGGSHDKNYAEGILSKDALFIAHEGKASLQPDNPTKVVNADFEQATGNHFIGWGFQDDEGVTTFADHEVTHSGKCSLRMENVGKNQYQHCRIAQPIKLQPHRQYRVSFWVKTENLSPANPEVKVLGKDGEAVSFQSFHTAKTQDWTHYDVVFNSLDQSQANFYLGTWYGKEGKLWWDDVSVEEIGLMNLLRRPGCPVTVRGENGTVYEEGRDFQRIVDSELHPWRPYHTPPVIRLASGSRIHEGDRLRVSYYHSIIVYDDRVTSCISEPKVFDEWRDEVKQANELLHPAGFLMSHDEMRVMNQCALCQSKHLTPGELLAWNVKQSAQIIHDLRPDAEVWVWNDMFDPNHNAVEHYYAVNGPLTGSWRGLDKSIGIVNWNGGKALASSKFFADLGQRQILSGYYDGDRDGSAIRKWIDGTRDMPGIAGAMYTTWEDDYAAMDTWSKAAWGASASSGK